MPDEKNPWQRKPQGPPDLLKLLHDFFNTKKGNGAQSQGGFHITSSWIWAIVALLILLWGLSGIYIVDQAQQAVVLQFGRYVETVGPGPHWLPTFIQDATKIDIQQIRNFQYQSEMLTQDENIVSVALAIQYRIDDPRDFLFNADDPVSSLQKATASTLRQAVGQMTLDSILTTGRAALSDDVAKQLSTMLAAYKMGLQVTDVRLLPAKPPEAVTEAFDDAIKAREDEQSSINKGEAYARKVTSEVKGNIAKLQQSAQAYQQQIVLQAQGDVARYNAMRQPYLATPEVTRMRMYLGTVQDVLSHTRNVIIDSNDKNVLYLPLDQMVKAQMLTPDTASTPFDQTSLPNVPLKLDNSAQSSRLEDKSQSSYSILNLNRAGGSS